MTHVEKYIRERIESAVRRCGHDASIAAASELSYPRQKGFGDLASNAALILAKKAKANPRELARDILASLDLDAAVVCKAETAGAGFINFFLSPDFFRDVLKDILAEEGRYGRSDAGGGKKTQVEFVSANPTGPLTIGHGRQAVIGDTVSRLLEATGHKVMREYYFNDAGRQMRVLADSVCLRYKEKLGGKAEFPGDYYQGEYIKDIASMAVEEKGSSLARSEDLSYFQKLAETTIFRDIQGTLARLGIRFDVFYNEKSLYETGKIDAVVRILREKDLAYDQDGAVWFRTSRLGMEQDRVIIKSTGEPTYRLPDIAYHKDKMDRGFDLVVDIFGADHIATYPDVLAGLKALGYDQSKITVLIHQFVTLVEGKEKVKMSTRKANFVTLDELMDEVGPDATRYFFLNRSMSSHLNFDLSLAKTQSDENPVYYVQYAHARICSILRHALEQGVPSGVRADLSLLTASEEFELLKLLWAFPRTVHEAALSFEPHKIPTYLEEVAACYHRFQHAGKQDPALRVVTQDTPLTQARLSLCRAVRTVLANGLDLLGISKPEKM